MKYLKKYKLNEEFIHWSVELLGEVEFERKEELVSLLYPFTDLGFQYFIDTRFYKTDFKSIGQREDYINGVDLYKAYVINLKIDFNNSDYMDMDKIIEIKEIEIELISRLRSMGFVIHYNINTGEINLYHPDDVVNKKFINETY